MNNKGQRIICVGGLPDKCKRNYLEYCLIFKRLIAWLALVSFLVYCTETCFKIESKSMWWGSCNCIDILFSIRLVD